MQLRTGGGAAGGAGDIGGFGAEHLSAHLGHQGTGKGAGDVGRGDEDLDTAQDTELGIVCKVLMKRIVEDFHGNISFPK